MNLIVWVFSQIVRYLVHRIERVPETLCEKVRGETGLTEDKCLKEMGIELILNGIERWNKGKVGNMGKMLLDRSRHLWEKQGED